jgi:hypothetical protein
MKHAPIFLLLLCLFNSCIKEVNFTVDDVPKQLVINSVLQAYQPVSVRVSGLQSILDTSILFIDDALVILSQDHNEVDTLRFISKGIYE